MSEQTASQAYRGPHQGQAVRLAGVPLEKAWAAMVMVHGRGATAESILALVPALDINGFAYLAPQAAGGTWYPNSFMAPIPSNEPGITSGLAAIASVMGVIEDAGLPLERTMLLGFSQGACLSLEYAARNAARFGGLACLSGGLIGPEGTPRDYTGSFGNTPAFLGCSDMDSHVPAARVLESATILKQMGADVVATLYPSMGHFVNDDEIENVRGMMNALAGPVTF